MDNLLPGCYLALCCWRLLLGSLLLAATWLSAAGGCYLALCCWRLLLGSLCCWRLLGSLLLAATWLSVLGVQLGFYTRSTARVRFPARLFVRFTRLHREVTCP